MKKSMVTLFALSALISTNMYTADTDIYFLSPNTATTNVMNMPARPFNSMEERSLNAATAIDNYTVILNDAIAAGDNVIAAEAASNIDLLQQVKILSDNRTHESALLKFARKGAKHAEAILKVYESEGTTFNSEGIRLLRELARIE